MKPWTHSDLQRLRAHGGKGLLSRRLTQQDLPIVRHALSEQQELLDLTIRLLGQKAEQLAALTEEVETLRRELGESEPWDTDDDTW